MNDSGRPSEDGENILLPLVIGVTGHHDLRDEDREPLEAQVGSIFDELESRYPSTPLILLSPLAEGADRLVARVALQKKVRLIVPLPMPKALYEEDFTTQASHDEFNKLLQQAEWWFELPMLKDTQEEEVRQQGPARDRQYAEVGAYIALHSEMLIALWDGTYTNRVGGTAQVVQFELQGVPEAYVTPRTALDEMESGPVYHIVTPRIKNPTPVGRSFTLHKLTPTIVRHEDTSYEGDSIDGPIGKKRNGEKNSGLSKEEFDQILEHLDSFNRDAVEFGHHLKLEQSKEGLLGNIDISTLPLGLKASLSHYADLYAIADSMAIYFKNRTVNTLLFLFSLFFIAVICFNVFADLGGFLVTVLGAWGQWLRFLFLTLYLVFLFGAYYIWYYRATRGHYKNKYLDYRALAEGLRVQFFWRLAGVPDTVAIHYLRKQKSELDWIRNSMRVANLLYDTRSSDDSRISTGALDGYYQLIAKQWVEDQSAYFTRAAKRDARKLERHEHWIRGFFLAGMALAVLLFLVQLFELLPASETWINEAPMLYFLLVKVPLVELLIVVMSVVLVLGALREGYMDKMAYNEQTKQYQRMSRLYRLASQRLNAALEKGKPQEAERVIRELGEEALAENGDWVILHRTRQLNVPMGG